MTWLEDAVHHYWIEAGNKLYLTEGQIAELSGLFDFCCGRLDLGHAVITIELNDDSSNFRIFFGKNRTNMLFQKSQSSRETYSKFMIPQFVLGWPNNLKKENNAYVIDITSENYDSQERLMKIKSAIVLSCLTYGTDTICSNVTLNDWFDPLGREEFMLEPRHDRIFLPYARSIVEARLKLDIL